VSVSHDEVRRIAALARLALPEPLVPELASQLSAILGHVDALSKVSTVGVEPAIGVGAEGMPLRVDAGPPYPLEAAREEFAPSMRDGLFLVPRLATHEDAAEVLE
jgi:aspartyl-tRNA(Asn)/glutamyl-tRNA(Gln) amidotransferase subunit C